MCSKSEIMDLIRHPEGILNLINQISADRLGDEFIMIDNFKDGSQNLGIINCPIKMVGMTITLCKTGQLYYNVDCEKITVNPNEIIILLPGKIVEIVGGTAEGVWASISIIGNYLEPVASYPDFQKFMHHIYVDPLISLNQDTFDEILRLYANLKAFLKHQPQSHLKMGLCGYLQVFFSFLLDVNHSKFENIGRSKELYYKFIDLVRKNYHIERSVAFFADKLCITPKYLSEVIKKASGYLPSQIISHMVILEAKAMIKTNRYTIAQISDILGFANPSFFAKYFKAHTGFSPIQYLNQV